MTSIAEQFRHAGAAILGVAIGSIPFGISTGNLFGIAAVCFVIALVAYGVGVARRPANVE